MKKSFSKFIWLVMAIVIVGGVFYLINVDIPAPTKLQVKELSSE